MRNAYWITPRPVACRILFAIAAMAVLGAIMWAEPADAAPYWSQTAHQMTTGDWNGDGRTDIIASADQREATTGEVLGREFYLIDGATQDRHVFALEPESQIMGMAMLLPGGQEPYPVLHVEYLISGIIMSVRYVDSSGELAEESNVYSPAPLPWGFESPVVSWNHGEEYEEALHVLITIETDTFPGYWNTWLGVWHTGECSSSNFDPAAYAKVCAGIGTAWIDPPITGTWYVRVYVGGQMVSETQKTFY